MYNRISHSCTRFPRAVVGVALLLMSVAGSGIAAAEPNDKQVVAGFSLVRSFSLSGAPEGNLQSQLFRKVEGNAVVADIVDLNLEFSAEHGKPMFSPPQSQRNDHSVILQFPDGWTTTNMVSERESPFICRIKMESSDSQPIVGDYLKHFQWCHALLNIGALDPALLENLTHR